MANPHTLYPEAVRRLRKILDRAGPNMGKTLIKTGAVSEYCLGIDLKDVGIKKNCQELPATRLLTTVELKELQKLLRLVE